MKGKILPIDYKTAKGFLLPRHYSGRMPSITWAFGWYLGDKLSAVCTFGKPASNSLCTGICNGNFTSNVYELNRLCRVEGLEYPLSQFVSACLRRLRAENVIVVSYSDTGMGHNGYIYQACNFLYTGITKQRTDKYTEGNKHSRHYDNSKQGNVRKLRTAKHRYVFIATKDKHFKREVMSYLQYPILPYPKGDNRYYTLGEYQKPILVDTKTGQVIKGGK